MFTLAPKVLLRVPVCGTMPPKATDVVLHTVIVGTRDLAGLAEFYRQGLGLPEPQASGDDHLGFRGTNAYFGLDRVSTRTETPGPVSAWFEVEDIEATFRRFVGLGAGVKYGPTRKPWGAILAAVTDPDGNVVGLTQRGTNPD